jgi:hypothetical protein
MSCVLDYVESQSLQKEDTRTLNLWAWAWAWNPSDITKVTWLTIVGRNITVHNVPPAGQSGLTFRVIVHLNLVEGFPGNEGQGSTCAFDWRLGVVDGESAPRDRHDPTPRRNDHHRDDDDNDRHIRRLQREVSWSTRLFRSISRAPKGCERERSGSRRDHRHNTSRRYMSGDALGGVRQVQQPRQAAAMPADASHVGIPGCGVENVGSRPHTGLAHQLREGSLVTRGRSRMRYLPRGAGRRPRSPGGGPPPGAVVGVHDQRPPPPPALSCSGVSLWTAAALPSKIHATTTTTNRQRLQCMMQFLPMADYVRPASTKGGAAPTSWNKPGPTPWLMRETWVTWQASGR